MDWEMGDEQLTVFQRRKQDIQTFASIYFLKNIFGVFWGGRQVTMVGEYSDPGGGSVQENRATLEGWVIGRGGGSNKIWEPNYPQESEVMHC